MYKTLAVSFSCQISRMLLRSFQKAKFSEYTTKRKYQDGNSKIPSKVFVKFENEELAIKILSFIDPELKET